MIYDWTFIILIPGIILAVYAQAKVKRAFAKYSKIPNAKGLTGAEVAKLILQRSDLSNIQIRGTGGSLTDNYDPQNGIINLSPDVSNQASIAAISVAAHEVGHAIQHKEEFRLLMLRNAMVPVVNIVSTLSWPLIVIGLIIGSAGMRFGYFILDLGIVFFLGVVLFHLVTLPVEIDASRKAVFALRDLDIISDKKEETGVRRVLSAAALTYVAALAVAILNLIRILIIRASSD